MTIAFTHVTDWDGLIDLHQCVSDKGDNESKSVNLSFSEVLFPSKCNYSAINIRIYSVSGGIKLVKSFSITGDEVESAHNKSAEQPSFVDVVNGIINQAVPTQKAVVGGINYADSWQLISLERGYYQVLLHSAEDSWEFWHLRIFTDLTRGIGILLRIDNSTLTRNYSHFARVLVDVDLAGFVPEKLLLETIDDRIEVDLYFESFLDFCISCHGMGHSIAKYEMVHQHHVVPSNKADINTKMDIEVRPSAPDLGVTPNKTNFDTEVDKSVCNSKNVQNPSDYDTIPHHVTSWANAFGDSDDENDDYEDNKVEDEWLPLQDDTIENEWSPLQGKGSSEASKENDVPLPQACSCGCKLDLGVAMGLGFLECGSRIIHGFCIRLVKHSSRSVGFNWWNSKLQVCSSSTAVGIAIVFGFEFASWLDNLGGYHTAGVKDTQSDRGKAVPKEAMPIRGISKELHPSFADVINGDKPWKVENLRLKLQCVWKLDNWQLISLGMDYFQCWHSVAKCMSVIRKAPPIVGSHGKEKENKAPKFTQVYKLKQTSSPHMESITPIVSITNAFEALNMEETSTHIDEMVHQHDAVPPSRADINIKIGIEVRPSASDLETVQTPSHYSTVPRQVTSWADAFGDSDNEIDDYEDDTFEDE
ncbi:hypothetical protein FNV43_RR27079 [Rhamnella rubrinervis]|uniref:Uncharacterized protein n=1 Tax=Rhamnella rubrinervis TaxID=2594499 RepID=A0A8K0GN54_9ROSA|nr:hypothetical protein FNV43_RR27079 [Rhamnella rubrinervis]